MPARIIWTLFQQWMYTMSQRKLYSRLGMVWMLPLSWWANYELWRKYSWLPRMYEMLIYIFPLNTILIYQFYYHNHSATIYIQWKYGMFIFLVTKQFVMYVRGLNVSWMFDLSLTILSLLQMFHQFKSISDDLVKHGN